MESDLKKNEPYFLIIIDNIISKIVVFLGLSALVIIFGCAVYFIIQIMDFIAFHFNYVLCAFIIFILGFFHFDYIGKRFYKRDDLKGFTKGGRITMSLFGLLSIVLLISYPESVRFFY